MIYKLKNRNMSSKILVLVGAIMFFFSCSSNTQNTANYSNKNYTMDTVSYSIGVMVASSLKSQGLDKVDAASVTAAINDVLEGNDLKVSEMDAQMNYKNYMEKQSAKQHASVKEAGEKFMAENGKKDGVTTTASGLQYSVIKSGKGPMPKATDKVNVHYHGTLIDGTVFDSSVDRGEPISFPVTGVIPGWVEALQLMHVGDKWKLYIPYNLAYGERGAGANIKPFSALIFEVELLGID